MKAKSTKKKPKPADTSTQSALIDLLERVGSQSEPVLMTVLEMNQWPPVAVAAMKSQKLLRKANQATSAVCTGCEENCMMPVYKTGSSSEELDFFILCDKRDDINRVAVGQDQLRRWQCSIQNVCEFVAASLGLRLSTADSTLSDTKNIGMMRGTKRTQMLLLKHNGSLALMAGSNTLTLVDLVDFFNGKFMVDAKEVKKMVNTAPPADPRYVPNTIKREVRKVRTKEKHDLWRVFYQESLAKQPTKSIAWHAEEISKRPEAGGCKPETIRKLISL
jgi:hypothetical protein